jgi:hypothetical protein
VTLEITGSRRSLRARAVLWFYVREPQFFNGIQEFRSVPVQIVA